jgi:hypothetical protein
MRLAITHDTRYRYSPPVQTAQHVAHLQAADTPCQTVLRHTMQITPQASVQHSIDSPLTQAHTINGTAIQPGAPGTDIVHSMNN